MSEQPFARRSSRTRSVWSCTVALLVLHAIAAAQAPAPPDSAVVQQAKTPQLEFSGILFANWSYRTDRGARTQNRFEVERAYLTFRMPAGDRASVRVTADIFQNSSAAGDAFYRGWAFRAKYA
ncbi:MAG: hypothetical protein M3125_09835, partial [Gemmatimonadota bacterium]|nr:hypothetical protein [Gemmatimonadota bacterium]